MARTYRCRHSCPTGWEVRDDDRTYYKAGYQTYTAYKQAVRAAMQKCREEGWPIWSRGPLFWHQFDDPPEPKFRRSFLCREKKAVRKADYRHYRNKIKNLMRHERYDDIWDYCRTGGWLTW